MTNAQARCLSRPFAPCPQVTFVIHPVRLPNAGAGLQPGKPHAASSTRIAEKTSWYIERIAPAQRLNRGIENASIPRFSFVVSCRGVQRAWRAKPTTNPQGARRALRTARPARWHHGTRFENVCGYLRTRRHRAQLGHMFCCERAFERHEFVAGTRSQYVPCSALSRHALVLGHQVDAREVPDGAGGHFMSWSRYVVPRWFQIDGQVVTLMRASPGPAPSFPAVVRPSCSVSNPIPRGPRA